MQGIGRGFESPNLHRSPCELSEAFKTKSRKGRKDRKNVDNRIQYVGQIASEGKHSKIKPTIKVSKDTNRVKEEQRVRKKDLFLASREKLLRAYGGCLGAECRRRTWDTAISPAEP